MTYNCFQKQPHNRILLSCKKQKYVTVLGNDRQNDRQNHVQYDENTSKIKKV